MTFKYIIRHNLPKRPIFVKDLVKMNNPNDPGFCSMPPKNVNDPNEALRHLHNRYTKEEIRNSRGLADAIAYGWFEPVDCSPLTEEEQSEKTILNIATSDEVAELKSQMKAMIEMMAAVIQKQNKLGEQTPVVIGDTGVSSSILEKMAQDLKDIKKKTVGVELEGYEELTPQQAALIARKESKLQIIKNNNIKVEKKKVDMDLNDLLDNLDKNV